MDSQLPKQGFGHAIKEGETKALWMNSLFSSKKKKFILLSLILIAATIFLFQPLGQYKFLNYDDNNYITENARLQSGLNWSTFRWAFTTTALANWHPLTWLSYMLDYRLFKLNPAGYHLTNLLLHGMNVVLLFFVLYYGTGFLWRSFSVAALFAFHPLNVQSVAWVAERKNVLSTLFWLLAIAAYGWYVVKPGLRRYLMVVILFAAGLMAKPMVVTLPFVLLLLDYWPLQRMNFDQGRDANPQTKNLIALVLEKALLIALSVASAIVTTVVQKSGGAVKSVTAYSFTVRLENALLAYAGYIHKALWPSQLAVFYPHPGNSAAAWKVTLAAVFLIVITGLVLRFKEKRYLLVGWFFYLGILVPVIGIVQIGNQAMADRYAYIPAMGLFVMMIWSISEWVRGRQVLQYVSSAVLVVVLLALSWSTRMQLGYWRDSQTLFSHALEVTSNNATAHVCLGSALAEAGRLEEAADHFHRALRIKPNDEMAHFNLGAYDLYRGDGRAALQEFEQVLQYTQNRVVAANAHVQMAAIYSQMGDMAESKAHYREAIQLDDAQYRAYLNLGVHLYVEGDRRGAIANLSRSLEILPTSTAYFYLGQALEGENRLAEALTAYREGLKISTQPAEMQDRIDAVVKKLQGTSREEKTSIPH